MSMKQVRHCDECERSIPNDDPFIVMQSMYGTVHDPRNPLKINQVDLKLVQMDGSKEFCSPSCLRAHNSKFTEELVGKYYNIYTDQEEIPF